MLEISTYVTRFGRSSFNMQFDLRIAGRQNPELTPAAGPIVTAETVYVHVSGTKGIWKSTPLPEDARTLLTGGGRGKIVDHAGYFPILRPRS